MSERPQNVPPNYVHEKGPGNACNTCRHFSGKVEGECFLHFLKDGKRNTRGGPYYVSAHGWCPAHEIDKTPQFKFLDEAQEDDLYGRSRALDDLVEERAATHGDIDTTHMLAVRLYNAWDQGGGDPRLKQHSDMCMRDLRMLMFFCKIARAVNGDDRHEDHWRDARVYLRAAKGKKESGRSQSGPRPGTSLGARRWPKGPFVKVLYVSGPLRAKTAWDVERNVRRAELVSLRLWQMGFAVMCPHTNTRHMNGAVYHETFMRGDLELMRRCDGIVMLPRWQESAGAARERQAAQEAGLPVFLWPQDLDKGVLRRFLGG